ncbi:hypothetical protein M514_12370 [Trichuris suis]|uniref:DUF7041 domain-containing protein n=1 Tax=Trichuris suis TaxID=68888 RepID=A0A085MTV3_9BILA|nr:hypothetical protein M513_12370 [Trichuris suis]KFD60649.1 hypothetical protein M514_12370 [Trichuris suis]
MAKKTTGTPASDGTCPPASTSQPLVSMALPVPPFMPGDIELWFARLHLFFQHRRIQDEPTILELTLSALPEASLSHLRDFILLADREPAPFTVFKRLCLQRLGESEDQQIRQALTFEQLADRPPSVFLRHLQQLLPRAPADTENPILRQLFLTRLPTHLQSALLPFRDKPLPELASLADQMLALQTPLEHAAAAQDLTRRLDRLERLVQQLTVNIDSRPLACRSS